METLPRIRDDGCLICGRTSDIVPVGVETEYEGDGPRDGERAWLCEDCAQVREYARAFITQARNHYGAYGSFGWLGIETPKIVYGFSYRIVSERMKAEYDEMGVHQFDEWTMD